MASDKKKVSQRQLRGFHLAENEAHGTGRYRARGKLCLTKVILNYDLPKAVSHLRPPTFPAPCQFAKRATHAKSPSRAQKHCSCMVPSNRAVFAQSQDPLCHPPLRFALGICLQRALENLKRAKQKRTSAKSPCLRPKRLSARNSVAAPLEKSHLRSYDLPQPRSLCRN